LPKRVQNTTSVPRAPVLQQLLPAISFKNLA